MEQEKVLIVEDEESLQHTLKYNFEQQNYRVFTASDGESGLELARKIKPDVIMLDLMLPKLSGMEVCKILRRETDVPILMLTARAEEVDKVVGLEIGADDYVIKPFSTRELLARVKALIRRSKAGTHVTHEIAEVLRASDLEVDLASHAVHVSGQIIELKPKEFDLLALLVAHKGRVFTRDQILERLWGHDYIGDPRTVDVHIRWLREKLEVDPSSPKRIITVRGVGYRFQT